MRRCFTLLIVCILGLNYAAAQEVVVRVSDFGAVPNDGKDDLKKIRKI